MSDDTRNAPRSKNEGTDGPVGLDALTVIVQVLENVVIVGVEHCPRNLSDVGEDVTSAGGIFTALQPRSELSVRVEDVQVV